MKKNIKIVVATLCLAAFFVVPSGASAGGLWQGCGTSGQPCYENNN
ncbi:hypothetical protein [Solibacillus sp. CAU 1738]